MSPSEFAKFRSTLESANLVAESFQQLLEEEKRQLTSTDRQAITALLDKKHELIDQLTGVQQSILAFCERCGVEPSYQALRAYLYRTGLSNAEQVLSEWTSLKNTLIKNQIQNKTNEAILTELLRRNEIKQTFIRNLGRSSDTYSATGQSQNASANGWVEQV